MRANYDPQKIWLQFIKVELYPSEKRGVAKVLMHNCLEPVWQVTECLKVVKYSTIHVEYM